MFNFVLLMLYFILTCSGLTFIKLGADAPLKISFSQGFSFAIGFKSLVGYILYICSFLLFTKLVTLFDLSYIMPITMGVVQIVTVVIALTLFKETLSVSAMVGIGLVVAGIVAMNLKF